jgi:energy-coupling factor transport system permease protein
MNRTGFYIERAGFVQRLNPITKLVVAVVLIAATFLIPGLFVAPLIFAVLLIPASVLGGVGRSFLNAILKGLFPIAISLVIVQGLFYPTADPTPIRVGPLTFRLEGLLFAAQTAGRLLVLAGAPLLIFLTTHPNHLVQALTERGVPRSLGYILLVALQLIPSMTERANGVSDAQRSRGLETEGSLIKRVQGVLPLVSPLLVGVLLEVEERAIALESRAFLATGPKTTLRDLPDSAVERWVRRVMLLALVGLIVGRILLAL